jgi:hypothetical protein
VQQLEEKDEAAEGALAKVYSKLKKVGIYT